MALPTALKASLSAAVNVTPERKAEELVLVLKLIRDICTLVIDESLAGPVTALRLVQFQNSLFRHKAFIQSQSLVTAESRAMIATHWPEKYANAAAVTTDIQASNTQFNLLTDEFELAIAAARVKGQLIDTNPTTGEQQDVTMTTAELADLRTQAQAVLATID